MNLRRRCAKSYVTASTSRRPLGLFTRAAAGVLPATSQPLLNERRHSSCHRRTANDVQADVSLRAPLR